MSVNPSLPRLLQAFFRAHLVARRNVSRHTVHAYRDAIKLLLTFVAARTCRDACRLNLDDLDRDAILLFLADLESQRGNSVCTRNARLAAVHSLFRFVATEEPASALLCQRVLSIPYKRMPARSVTCLDREEVEHILNSIGRSDPGDRRDLALLQFLYNTGARAQEVVDLDIAGVRFDPPTQVRIVGKGRKERLCPLWTETSKLLRDMLRDRGVPSDDNAPLFTNAWGHRLTRFGVWHIVRSRVTLAAASSPSLRKKRISPHTIRHTTALHLLQAGVDLNVVRSWLGHASIETTHGYVEIDMQMKSSALTACGSPTAKGQLPSWQEPGILSWLEEL